MVKGRSITKKMGVFHVFYGLGLELAHCHFFHIQKKWSKKVSWPNLTSSSWKETLVLKGKTSRSHGKRYGYTILQGGHVEKENEDLTYHTF